MPHYPGYLREAFLDWIDNGCPPVATVEVHYEPQTWPAEQLCRRMFACSDVVPGHFYRETVERFGLERSRRQTYASLARLLLENLSAKTAA